MSKNGKQLQQPSLGLTLWMCPFPNWSGVRRDGIHDGHHSVCEESFWEGDARPGRLLHPGQRRQWQDLCLERSVYRSFSHEWWRTRRSRVAFQSGNGANAEEKNSALKMADTFIDQMKYPRMKTQVVWWKLTPSDVFATCWYWLCCRWRSCRRGRRPSSSSSSSKTGTEHFRGTVAFAYIN